MSVLGGGKMGRVPGLAAVWFEFFSFSFSFSFLFFF